MISLIPVQKTHYILSVDMRKIFPGREEDDQKIISYIDKLSSENYPSTPSNVMSWRSEWDSHNVHREILQNFLRDFFFLFNDRDLFYSYWDYWNDESFANRIILAESWMSKQKEGDWVRLHDHKGTLSSLSFCYYLQMEKNSSPIVFQEDGTPSVFGTTSKRRTEVHPKTGTLLIFDSNAPHSVDGTVGDRYNIAGNVFLDLLFGKELALSSKEFFASEN